MKSTDPFLTLATAYSTTERYIPFTPSTEMGRTIATCLDVTTERERSVIQALCGFEREPMTVTALARIHGRCDATIAAVRDKGIFKMRTALGQRLNLLQLFTQSLSLGPPDPDIAIDLAYTAWQYMYEREDTPADILTGLGIDSLRSLIYLSYDDYSFRFRRAMGKFQDARRLWEEEYRLTQLLVSYGLCWDMSNAGWQTAIHRIERMGLYLPPDVYNIGPST